MPWSIKDSDSLANFTSTPTQMLERLRQSGQPMLLTIAAVKEGLHDMAAGRTRPLREALAELAVKFRLPSAQDE